jgi:5-methylcytosine-specific restriction endonuclease McrA
MLSDEVLPERCLHATREIRRRVIASGSVVFCAQCLTCGSSKAVKRDALSPADRAKAPPFDEELPERRWQQQKERFAALRQARAEEEAEKNCQWWTQYNRYLQTPEWKALRTKILQRSPVCEGCGVRSAVSAHHVTYERVGREMLFDLRAVCQQCHDRIHSDRSC